MEPIFRDGEQNIIQEEHQNIEQEQNNQQPMMVNDLLRENDHPVDDMGQNAPNVQQQQAPRQQAPRRAQGRQENPVKIHIREMLDRQKRMEADEPDQQNQQGNLLEENRQEQQAGGQQQKQQILAQVQNNIHQQLQTISQNVNELLDVNAGVKTMAHHDLVRTEPDFGKLLMVYSKTGFEYADSGQKRYKLLLEAEERYKLQGKLRDNIYNYDQRLNHANPKDLTLEKAMTYSDDYLVSHYMEFGGHAQDYLELRYSLMKNPFYSVLPVKQLKEMSRYELIKKLKKESATNKPNQYLIAFYHDLIRLQTMETNEKRNKLRKNSINAPEEMTEKERSNNHSYLIKNVAKLQSNLALSEAEKKDRTRAMRRVLENRGRFLFLNDKTDAEKKHVNDNTIRGRAKKEGIRQILAWMYRNCNKSKASMEPLVFRLTQAHPAQLLHMFYLIEHDMATNPNAECFHSAIETYVPDLNNFAKKANWDRIGQVAGFVMKCDVAKEYLQIESQEDELKAKLADESPERKLEGDEKEVALLRLLLLKGKKLVNMYKAGGLDPNMPVELIQDNDLKAQIQRTVQEFNDTFMELDEVNKEALKEAGGANGDGPVEGGPKAKLTEKISNKDTSTDKKAILDDTKKYSSAVLGTGDNIIKLAGAGFKTEAGYVLPMGGLNGLLGLVGAISAIVSAKKLTASAATVAGADYIAKQISIYSDISKNMADMAKGVVSIVNHYIEVPKTAANTAWIGNTNIVPISESCKNVTGAIQFGAGVVTIGAGALQIISSTIDLKQARQSKQHLKKAKDTLAAYEPQTEHMNPGVEKQKREYKQEQLRSLFKDRDNVNANKNLSGAVKMIGGFLTAGGGVLSATGILAPIGSIMSLVGCAVSIGFGMIYARIHRNKAIEDAVDDGLKMTMLMDKVKNAYNLQNLQGDDLESLKNAVRQEALAELHYGSVMDCYRGMSKKVAQILYNNVLENPAPVNSPEYKMYYNTLLSLRFKPAEIKRARYSYETHKPTLGHIYTRLTEGV